MKYRKFIWILFPIIGSGLFVIHGLGKEVAHFEIDYISISLLLFAAIPLSGQFLETLKFGNVEAQFRTLSFAGQVSTFLHVLATDRKLTFYQPREKMGESLLGTASRYLLDRMLEENRKRTIRTIKKWLNEEEENLRWFASETIGFLEIKELAEELLPHYSNLNPNSEWSDWQLNCLWAHSKLCNEYKELGGFLIKTKSISNQDWVLDVYPQMCKARESTPSPEDSCNLLKKFLERPDLDILIKEKTEDIMNELRNKMEPENGQANKKNGQKKNEEK